MFIFQQQLFIYLTKSKQILLSNSLDLAKQKNRGQKEGLTEELDKSSVPS